MRDDDVAKLWIMRDTSWSRLGLPLAAVLFAFTPLVRRGATRLTYLQLPVYMLHQYEEHAHGAFKRYINALIPPTVGHLTDRTIFWINIPCVWGVDSLATALAATKIPSLGLLPPYLAVVNAILHILPTLATRRYNPGLGTGVALFLPFGVYSIRAIGQEARATRRTHLAALGAASALHLVVVIGVLRGRRPQDR